MDNQSRKEHTSIIHGKYSHEETVATASFATTYLIVRDLPQTQYLCDYIINGGDREHFLQTFKHAHSEGAPDPCHLSLHGASIHAGRCLTAAHTSLLKQAVLAPSSLAAKLLIGSCEAMLLVRLSDFPAEIAQW